MKRHLEDLDTFRNLITEKVTPSNETKGIKIVKVKEIFS